jgi:osmoprotectant transport system permease protein
METGWLQSVSNWVEFAGERMPELGLRTGEHLVLTGLSTGLAIAIGLPLGILASTKQGLRAPLLATISIFQTIPSLAMLAILLALVGKIGAVPAIIALTIYALLPIVRNTVTGIEGVPSEVVEAARGIGMTPRQQLRMVQLPLAMPVMIAGIRTAAVMGVGIATLSAFIGAGGLGQFINRGLALSNTQLILLGAIPARKEQLQGEAETCRVGHAVAPCRAGHLRGVWESPGSSERFEQDDSHREQELHGATHSRRTDGADD